MLTGSILKALLANSLDAVPTGLALADSWKQAQSCAVKTALHADTWSHGGLLAVHYRLCQPG